MRNRLMSIETSAPPEISLCKTAVDVFRDEGCPTRILHNNDQALLCIVMSTDNTYPGLVHQHDLLSRYGLRLIQTTWYSDTRPVHR